NGPPEQVVSLKDESAVAVSSLHLVAGCVQHQPPAPGVYALVTECSVRQVVRGMESTTAKRIDHLDLVTPNVVSRARHVPGVDGILSVALNRFDRSTQRIQGDAYGCIPMVLIGLRLSVVGPAGVVVLVVGVGFPRRRGEPGRIG